MSDAVLAATCPRCAGGFECGASSGPAGHCACFGIRLDNGLRAELAQRYPGRCLCLGCLRELSELSEAVQPPLPSA
jgi:Cysteine-rich CWC